MENDDKDNAATSADAAAASESPDTAVTSESGDEAAGSADDAEKILVQPERASGMPRLLAVFALLVAFVSASLAGFLWWQYRQFYVELNDADDSNQLALRQARTQLVALEDKLDDLGEDDRKLRTAVEAVRDDVAHLPPRFVDFEERLQSLQGVSENSRRAWLRAEVQYLLSLANTELVLGRRWDTARQALTLADAKLRELANPSLMPVRQAIASAVQRLNAVPLADSEGLNLTLGNLASEVSGFPLKASADRSEFETGPVPIDKPPGLERAWASFKAALAGLVRIEKREVPVRRALTLREESLLRLSLELELEAARLSLLRADGAGFRTSVASAQRSLSADFDAADGGVRAALEVLAGMAEVTIDPPRPDISQPSLLMQQLTEPSEQAPRINDGNADRELADEAGDAVSAPDSPPEAEL